MIIQCSVSKNCLVLSKFTKLREAFIRNGLHKDDRFVFQEIKAVTTKLQRAFRHFEAYFFRKCAKLFRQTLKRRFKQESKAKL